MSYTYANYVSALQNVGVYPANNADQAFANIVASAIDYAELRIQRDLDLLSTVTTDHSTALTAGLRSLTLPSNPHFVVLAEVNAITPALTTNPELGKRNPLSPVSKEVLDNFWPDSTGSALPTMFARINDTTIIVGPWPDAAYTLELVGTYRPTSLSASNTTTWISTYLPDMFLAASMVFLAGYQRDYGAQSDDPQMAMSWERQYEVLLGAAKIEEARKKYESSGWTPSSPAQAATPNR